MRIVALVRSPDYVCCRYRLAAYQPSLREHGHTLELLAWPRAWLSRLWLHNLIGEADVLIIQRKMPPTWQLSLLRRVAPILIYDVDDALFCRDSNDPNGVKCPSRLAQFRSTVEHVDYVVAGNAFLQDQVKQWVSAEHTVVIPTCVDVTRYPVARHHSRDRLSMAWIGTWSTLQCLDRVRSMWEAVGQACPWLTLKIVCDQFLQFNHLAVQECRWAEETEAEELATADVGISWLPDDLWSQGKCGLKVLQYMAAGLPVLANPVGLHCRLIQHGHNGFFVESRDELIHALELLRADPDLRRQMGIAGRRFVQTHYSTDLGAGMWARLLGRIAARQAAGVPIPPTTGAVLLTD